jgi:hypothetical protein
MSATSQFISEPGQNAKVDGAIYFFWVGFLIYSLSYTISTSDSVNYIVCQALQILGLGLMVPSAILLARLKFDSTYLQVIFIIYIAWLITVIFRGFLFDYQFLKHMLFDATFGIFIYFAPLILLFPRKLAYYRVMFNVILVAGIAYIIFDLIFIKDLLSSGRNIKSQTILEYFSNHLSLPAGFLLLTFMYHTKKRNLLAFIVIVLTFFLATVRARRGLMFMSASILVAAFYMFYYSRKMKLIVFVLSALVIYGIYFFGSSVYTDNKTGYFLYLTERLDEKTRSGVEAYFYNDLKTNDWIIGKGIMGQYFCPGIDKGNLSPFRGVIETGYLQIILKGGILSLSLFLLITIPAIILGLFFSKNMLSKAAAIWIFLALVNLYPATVVSFSLNYLLVWVSVGICYSGKIRNSSEMEVTSALANR